MQLKENINVRKIGNDYVLVSDNQETLDYTRVVAMNESAAYLIQNTGDKAFTFDLWCDLLQEKYGVAPEIARRDVLKLIEQLEKAGLIK